MLIRAAAASYSICVLAQISILIVVHDGVMSEDECLL